MHCYFCDRKINTLYNETALLDGASRITPWKDFTIIIAGYGSRHDNDICFINDRELAKELKNTEAYICDDCFTDLVSRHKLVLFEAMGAPWNVYPNKNPNHVYQSIPREIIAWTYQDLYEMEPSEQEKYQIKVENRIHPMRVENFDHEQVVNVLYDDVVILTEIGKFEVMKKYQFEKLFTPKV